MNKKKQGGNPNKEQAAPNYRIFGNEILNDIFCHTEEEANDFCQMIRDRFMECVAKRLDPTLPPGDKEQHHKMQRYLVAHICGHIEAAFELGWNEAMQRASKVMLEDLL